MGNLDPEPPIARVIRGGGSRFAVARSLAKHHARRIGRGAGTLVRIGAILGFVVGIFAVGTLGGGTRTSSYDGPHFDIDKMMRDLRAMDQVRANQQQWLRDLQLTTTQRLEILRTIRATGSDGHRRE